MQEKTIFERILNKEIPFSLVYEDDFVLAFDDIHPQAPVHVLIIPKRKIVDVNSMQENDIELVGRVLFAAKKVARIKGVEKSGYRLIFNNGPQAGQTVFYMHCHLVGGRDLSPSAG